MKITTAMLHEADACSTAIEVFAEHWPDGAEVTIENARKAQDIGLDLDWAVSRLFPIEAIGPYNVTVQQAWLSYYSLNTSGGTYREAKVAAFVEAAKTTEPAHQCARADTVAQHQKGN